MKLNLNTVLAITYAAAILVAVFDLLTR